MDQMPSATSLQIPSLFELLKQETSDLHREIQEQMPVLRPQLNLQQYKRHLANLLGFYLPFENHLSLFMDRHGDDLDLEKRFKSHLLISDLLALGESPQKIEKTPHCEYTPQMKSPAELVGSLYVTEGSTLGAQIIQKRLRSQLGLPDSQMRFYTGYGEKTRQMWEQFQTAAQNIISRSDHRNVTESARATFQSLHDWLLARPLS